MERPYPDSCFTPCPFDPTEPQIGQFIKLHYRIWSRDELQCPYRYCLLVHGFASSTYNWRQQVNSLLESHDMVIAVDLPGFGYSGRDRHLIHSDIRRAHWLLYLVRHIESLYNASDSNSYHWSLIGHGMGARVVSALVPLWNQQQKRFEVVKLDPAMTSETDDGKQQQQDGESDAPPSIGTGTTQETKEIIQEVKNEDVSGANIRSIIENVVLISPESLHTDISKVTLQDKLMMGWLPTTIVPFTVLHWLLSQQTLLSRSLHKYCYNNNMDLSHEELEEIQKPLLIPDTVQCFADMIEFNEYRHGIDLKEMCRLTPRLLFICGTDDRVIPIEHHIQLYSHLQMCHDEISREKERNEIRLEVFQGAGHNLMETHDEQLNSIVNEFCVFPERRVNNGSGPRQLLRGASSQILNRVSSLFKLR